jgi:hypothetical protein
MLGKHWQKVVEMRDHHAGMFLALIFLSQKIAGIVRQQLQRQAIGRKRLHHHRPQKTAHGGGRVGWEVRAVETPAFRQGNFRRGVGGEEDDISLCCLHLLPAMMDDERTVHRAHDDNAGITDAVCRNAKRRLGEVDCCQRKRDVFPEQSGHAGQIALFRGDRCLSEHVQENAPANEPAFAIRQRNGAEFQRSDYLHSVASLSC